MDETDSLLSGRMIVPDSSVPQQDGEGYSHWAIKATVVSWLRSDPRFSGHVEVEKKVEDLIADVRCRFDDTDGLLPERCVIEVVTRHSNMDVVQKTRRYHRWGYSVFYVYSVAAYRKRRRDEEALADVMSQPLSLGIASLEDNELQLGHPLHPGSLDEDDHLTLPWNELYIPTHKRSNQAYDHGDFQIGPDRAALISIDGRVHASYEVSANGQRTLPMHPGMDTRELTEAFMDGTVSRLSPVRGAP